jgi:hypothetical protein
MTFFVDSLFCNSHIQQHDYELLLPKASQALKEKPVESLPVFSPENFASIPQNRSIQQSAEVRKPRPSSSAPRVLSVHAPAGVDLFEATYSGIDVYELVINDVQVMRRRDGGWVNATHILKVAGVEKGRR